MSIKDVIPEGIASLVPDNLSNRTPLSDLRSILVRDAAKEIGRASCRERV